MAMTEVGPAEKLAELLEGATPDVRREITAWLLRENRPPPAIGVPWLAPPVGSGGETTPGAPGDDRDIAEQVRRLAINLPAGVDSQVVTLRLPAERHAALRDWCVEHGFSMAAVVRGLVERFLEERAVP